MKRLNTYLSTLYFSIGRSEPLHFWLRIFHARIFLRFHVCTVRNRRLFKTLWNDLTIFGLSTEWDNLRREWLSMKSWWFRLRTSYCWSLIILPFSNHFITFGSAYQKVEWSSKIKEDKSHPTFHRYFLCILHSFPSQYILLRYFHLHESLLSPFFALLLSGIL